MLQKYKLFYIIVLFVHFIYQQDKTSKTRLNGRFYSVADFLTNTMKKIDKKMEENKDLQGENNTFPNEELKNTENQETEKTADLAEDSFLEEQMAEQKDQYIRLFAEFENYKRRTQKEKLEFAQYANQNLMLSLLPVLDDFERALKELAKSEDDQYLKGVELIYQKFKNTLSEKGLKSIEVKAGDGFNVDFHEAVTQISAPSEELKGKIVDVIETGYQLHDKVIRFAKVVTGM